MFVKTSELGYNNGRTKSIEITNDGEWHTYRIMFDEVPEIKGKGTVTGIRFDAGYFEGEVIEFKDIKIQKLDASAPYVFLDRTLHTYSDKLHQELHFVAPAGQQNIDALGMITNIPADKVEKLIVKDGKGLHESLDGVDWSKAEYVGFDIKGVGIFGYIMPFDNKSGSINVTLKDGIYTIIQEATPENNEILSPYDTKDTSNDFFMGQRIYTDETHDFADFLREAEWERHPMTSIKGDSYLGYDALRGAYHFKINGTSFNTAYYSSWNTHYSSKATIKNFDEDRNIYIRSINNFKKDFVFYRFLPSSTPYKLGYVNKSNEISREKVDPDDKRSEFVLGNEAPFFGTYDLRTENAVNIGFLIHSSDITIGGEKFNGNFIVIEETDRDYCLSLDLEKVTLKAGDSINFNIIITPWGSHLTTDITNLIDMRENSILDPYKVEVIDGEIIETTYMPKIRSTNGKSAEFTISGGANNAAVRVYGFNKLTAPKIYEKIDDVWVPYEVCSINSPDNTKAKNYYDGYFTYYDGDGTYSYAFAVNMDESESRTFKIIANHDFEPWPEVIIENDDPINLYLDPAEISAMLSSGIPGIGKAEISEKADYIRITGDGKGKNSEVSLGLYSATSTLATGQYLVLKYRMPSTNTETNRFEFFISTVNTSASGSDSIHLLSASTAKKDDQWNLLVIDASKYLPNSFIAADDGLYYCQYIRFDIFNTQMSADSYVDIAYVGMCDSLDKIRELNSDMEKLLLCTNKGTLTTIDVKTGNTIESSGGNTPKPVDDGVTVEKNGASLIAADNAQGYTLSEIPYFARVDSINGYGPNKITGKAYSSRGSNSKDGIATFKYNAETTDDMALVIAGWSLIYGNAEKYVWSADGGKTWNDVKLRGRNSLDTAVDAMIKYANDTCGKTDFDKYAAKSAYQGQIQGPGSASGLSADLSAFKGQTVNVTFAAVPAEDNDTLCILAHITGVQVKEKIEEEAENPYNDPINFLLSADEIYEAFGEKKISGIGSMTLSEDSSYVSITGSGDGKPEAILDVFKNPGNVATGQYLVLKYRVKSTNSVTDYFHFYTSTVLATVSGANYLQHWLSQNELNDNWHVIILDASSILPDAFVAKNGKYFATHLRFDVFNMARPDTDCVDIAYIGFSDSIEDICALNTDMETLMLCTKSDKPNRNTVQYIDVKTGEITD